MQANAGSARNLFYSQSSAAPLIVIHNDAARDPLLQGGSVHALGALPHPQIVQLLSQADCYCLPTEYAEGFPTTLLEAAGCGCPILCTPTAGTEELLPGDSAVFLPDTTPEAIRTGLQKILDHPDTAHDRAVRARENTLAHFTWDAVFDKLIQNR